MHLNYKSFRRKNIITNSNKYPLQVISYGGGGRGGEGGRGRGTREGGGREAGAAAQLQFSSPNKFCNIAIYLKGI